MKALAKRISTKILVLPTKPDGNYISRKLNSLVPGVQ